MPHYVSEPEYRHGDFPRIGVLIANLGTPDAPTPTAIRRFLAEFLWDPRVVEAPRWLWWLALHGVILRSRPRRSAHAYQQIWTSAGSPLLVHSRALLAQLRERVSRELNAAAALGMSYGTPSIPAALDELRRAGARRLLVLPLYPQYSATTTGSVFDQVTSELQTWRWTPELRFINGYHDDPAYIQAIAASITAHWRTRAENGAASRLLFSFHGVPRRYLLAGDPYHCQCLKTARLVAATLGLAEDAWTVSFQSQVGREEWLRPYTDEWLIQFARQGGRKVTVVCPGFAADCLETLEEIALRNRARFLANGGESYDYVPALNADPTHAAFLATLIRRHSAGWPTEGDASEAAASRERALQQGAVR
ncbi:MAG TPA: ferrochelatase [Steroidobacter sp.]|jgi:ferrochelatase|nr:ferrochelatase [Steroidobacter sp.]